MSTTLEGTPNPEAPNPQLPIVQKLRVRYAKRGRLRFTSHRDFGRAFERAVRRAKVPIGYSSGFTPHPKISYANAAPTGAASEAEFLEIGLTRECDPDAVREGLDAALPPGLDIVAVVPATPGTFADRLEASRWRIEIPGATGLEDAATGFLAAPAVTVERMTKRGLRDIDVRGAVDTLVVHGDRVDVVVRSMIPTVRPDDVVGALRQFGAVVSGATIATRIEQGPLVDGVVVDPLT
ncbi:MAG: TIGR03936 family radical SAM-associated protein [Aeromicrobium sp.]|uniref:TIGR03936 family radical SAM-associated protein n=1 Tax=Aeromicrobium sp. TaxID=1871063 RepID=UPI0026337FE6|nr:TIGR03936 family radical SAM-associated protein [Aeromicrobium sp.]MDF1703718.1 TIGR03936 family radical SAM-associated protein [Aeromicrobium sp.]